MMTSETKMTADEWLTRLKLLDPHAIHMRGYCAKHDDYFGEQCDDECERWPGDADDIPGLDEMPYTSGQGGDGYEYLSDFGAAQAELKWTPDGFTPHSCRIVISIGSYDYPLGTLSPHDLITLMADDARNNVCIQQRSGEPKLTDASYATVAAAWNAANDAGQGYPYDRAENDYELLHSANRTDELDVYRADNGTIIAVSNDGWACDVA